MNEIMVQLQVWVRFWGGGSSNAVCTALGTPSVLLRSSLVSSAHGPHHSHSSREMETQDTGGTVTCAKVTWLKSSFPCVMYSKAASHAYRVLYFQIWVLTPNLFLCRG